MTPAEAVKFMMEHKISRLRTPDGLEIDLMPEALLAKSEPVAPEAADDPTLDEMGNTGMTRREQIELLGIVHEGDFRKKRA